MRVLIFHKEKNKKPAVEYHLAGVPVDIESRSLLDSTPNAKLVKGFDVVIFDVIGSYGDTNDVNIVRHLRNLLGTIPIFLSTGETEGFSYRESMFDAGVDGCIQVPFSPDELFIRLQKLVKKKDSLLFSGTTIASDTVSMDIRNHVVEKNGTEIPLTKTEYGILFHLFVHKKDIVEQDALSPYLQSTTKEGSSALNIHILNIRRKLGEDHIIKTIPHFGFSVS